MIEVVELEEDDCHCPISDKQLKEDEKQLSAEAMEGKLELLVLACCFLIFLFHSSVCTRSASKFSVACLQVAVHDDLSRASSSILCGSSAQAFRPAFGLSLYLLYRPP